MIEQQSTSHGEVVMGPHQMLVHLSTPRRIGKYTEVPRNEQRNGSALYTLTFALSMLISPDQQ